MHDFFLFCLDFLNAEKERRTNILACKTDLLKNPKVFISSTLFFNIFIYLIPGLYIMIPRRVTVSYICPYIFRSLIPVLIVSSRRLFTPLSLSLHSGISFLILTQNYPHIILSLFLHSKILLLYYVITVCVLHSHILFLHSLIYDLILSNQCPYILISSPLHFLSTFL